MALKILSTFSEVIVILQRAPFTSITVCSDRSTNFKWVSLFPIVIKFMDLPLVGTGMGTVGFLGRCVECSSWIKVGGFVEEEVVIFW